MTKANHKVFGPDGAQWHDDVEVAAYQRLLFEDAPAGAVRRRNLVNGIDPVEFVTTTPEAVRAKQRLVERARRKDGLTTQTNYLGKIDQATYSLHFAGKAKGTAPGPSGACRKLSGTSSAGSVARLGSQALLPGSPSP
jgi:hypothetical protein